ncbi:MAG: NADH-quinone oxidoreductase subunit M [bacterium]|nr:NADH-quinone oxidoreductase subunit M [bacterium]
MAHFTLTSIIFLPLLGSFIILLIPRKFEDTLRGLSLLLSTITFGLSLSLWFGFDKSNTLFQFIERYSWISELGIYYYLGVDGFSVLLVLLTTFLTPICILISWDTITHKIKEYYFSFLFLEAAMVGVFVALDVFLFYVFWEAILIPMYFLIGIWGGKNRLYASIKFFLYTLVGSLLMLIGILYLYFQHSGTPLTFDLVTIIQNVSNTPIPYKNQIWLFLAFAIAFAIKVPLFPFHTWLPDAHTEAPTAGSIILAGVLLKMGTYGFLRFAMPLFPFAVDFFTPLLILLSIIGIIYGALVAMVQTDVKRLVAYSSVSHLGFVVLGMFMLNHQGVTGSVLQMINHGLSTGALFLLVGVIYDRRHTREINAFGGIAATMPVYTTIFLIVTLSSIGLPMLNGFVGEFLILLGTAKNNWVWTAWAATGIILSAVYLLWMVQRVFFGPIVHEENQNLTDMNWKELAAVIPILIVIIWIGIYPSPFLEMIETTTDTFLKSRSILTISSVQFP